MAIIHLKSRNYILSKILKVSLAILALFLTQEAFSQDDFIISLKKKHDTDKIFLFVLEKVEENTKDSTLYLFGKRFRPRIVKLPTNYEEILGCCETGKVSWFGYEQSIELEDKLTGEDFDSLNDRYQSIFKNSDSNFCKVKKGKKSVSYSLPNNDFIFVFAGNVEVCYCTNPYIKEKDSIEGVLKNISDLSKMDLLENREFKICLVKLMKNSLFQYFLKLE